MKAKRLVGVGVGIAVLLGGAAIILDQMAEGSQASTAVPSISDPAVGNSTGAGPAGGGGPPDAAGVNPGGTGAGGGTGQTTGTGESTAGSAPAAGVAEVLPPVSSTPSGLPVPSPPPALISSPLPATAFAQGKIVDGFPADVLSFPDGTVVVSTGVSSADGALQVAADAIAASSQDSVVGHFQQILGPLKFWSEPAQAAEGQRAVRFGRGNDSITLTTSTTGTGSTRFMLLGNLHTTAG